MTAPRLLCIVLHDVADRTLPACDRVLQALAEVAPGLPLTHLAVPRYHGEPASPALARWLTARSSAGDELSLHGCTHRDDGTPRHPLDRLRRRVYTRGEGEFWALSAAQARQRLQPGLDWFGQHGWPLHGFVPPAWLLGPGGWQALQGCGAFRYVATFGALHRLDGNDAVAARPLVYSTSRAWRRASSVAWAAVNAALLAPAPLLRLELHPPDALHAAVRRSWQRVLGRALEAGRTPATVMQCVDALAPAQPAFTAG